MEEIPREEAAAEDPFGGTGVFLAAPGLTSLRMLEFLASLSETVIPAVAWDHLGAWADLGSPEAANLDLKSGWHKLTREEVTPNASAG